MTKTTFRALVCVWTVFIVALAILSETVFPAPIGMGLLAGMTIGYAIRQAFTFWRAA